MKTVNLGHSNLAISQIGLGCMGMSDFYGPGDDAHSITVMERALELGINFFDTADAYGPFLNEELVGRFLKGRRHEVVLATKFSFIRDKDGNFLGISGDPKYVRSACEASLLRLEVDEIDLYYQHRVDPNIPVEDTVGAMADLVKEGKVRHIGLSEASSKTLRRASAIHPVSALQTEYSLWTREPEEKILSACRELGITFVAYSPLGRGFLTGALKNLENLAPDDWRRSNPRFQGENLKKNLAILEKIEAMAHEKECTPAQLALAWVLAQGEDIVPIPGTKRIKYLEENAAASEITLTPEELNRLNEMIPPGAAAGTRYAEGAMRIIDKDE